MQNKLDQDSGDGFLEQLDTIAAEDAAGLKKAALSYGNSWKQRGGVGAFMMLARKWDRMEKRLTLGLGPEEKGALDRLLYKLENVMPDKCVTVDNVDAHILGKALKARTYDIFHHIAVDPRAEGIIDDVRDLRRYLMLVEAEMRARGFSATHRDNKG